MFLIRRSNCTSIVKMQHVFYIFMYELLDVVSILFNATRRGEFVKEEKSFSIISFYIEILLIENEFDSKIDRIDEGK